MIPPARLAAAWAAAAMAAEAQAAASPLIVHYNERSPYHYTERGVPQGPAIAKVAGALAAAHIRYTLRSTPAKQQLVLLQKNEAPACMLAWVDLPGRDGKGKLSEKIYDERRLWCTKATPDEVMQRIDAALHNAAPPK